MLDGLPWLIVAVLSLDARGRYELFRVNELGVVLVRLACDLEHRRYQVQRDYHRERIRD